MIVCVMIVCIMIVRIMILVASMVMAFGVATVNSVAAMFAVSRSRGHTVAGDHSLARKVC